MSETVRWWEGRLCSFDVETTGVDYEQDRIVTAAVSIVGGGEPPLSFSWLLNPGVEIPEGATAVHGVTTERAVAEGRPAADALAEILAVLQEAIDQGFPLIVFNARFDLTMLDREARRYGLVPLARMAVICPMVLDKHYDQYRKGKRTLARCCEVYNVEQADGAHEAVADAMAAARVAWRIARAYRELGDANLLMVHAWQVEWAREQADGLEAHFRKQGRDDVVEREWPVVPAP